MTRYEKDEGDTARRLKSGAFHRSASDRVGAEPLLVVLTGSVNNQLFLVVQRRFNVVPTWFQRGSTRDSELIGRSDAERQSITFVRPLLRLSAFEACKSRRCLSTLFTGKLLVHFAIIARTH